MLDTAKYAEVDIKKVKNVFIKKSDELFVAVENCIPDSNTQEYRTLSEDQDMAKDIEYLRKVPWIPVDGQKLVKP